MSDGFLSRWSRRKLEAKEQLVEPTQRPGFKEATPQPETQQVNAPVVAEKTPSPTELQLPTEQDLFAVEQGGDIKAFMTEKVSSELKNRAFKALFSRPEFNVMDGLDIYIDDYNKFTPLTKADIDKMSLSKQLLSRPDLEKPEVGTFLIDRLEEGTILPEPATVETLNEDHSVQDKSDQNPMEPEPAVLAADQPRVIPDISQVTENEGNSVKRSIENQPEK